MKDNNLLNKANNEIELDVSIIKIIVLAFIGLGLAFCFGYFLRLFILEGQANFFLFSFLAAIAFLSLYLLDIFFIKTIWLNNLIVFLGILAFLAPFYDQFSGITGLMGFIGFLLMVWGVYSGRNELGERLKIKFWEISKKSLPKVITGLALIVAVISVGLFNLDENNFFISKPTFEKNISWLFSFSLIQNFVPGFNLSLSVENLIKTIAINQIEGNPQLKILPLSAKNQLINQTAKGLEDKIAEFIGMPLNPNTRASEELYEIIVKKVSQAPENSKSLILVIIGVLILLIILSLSWVIRLIATIPAYIVYEICLALGFSTIMLEDKSREIILLK